MEDTEYVYLITSFPSGEGLREAARALALPPHRVAVLGNERSGAAMIAEELGVSTELDPDIKLDSGQDERLVWHLREKDHPLLAITIMAVEGSDVRKRLIQFGGSDIALPNANVQIGDEEMDPGMTSEEPDLPPQRGGLTDSDLREEHRNAE